MLRRQRGIRGQGVRSGNGNWSPEFVLPAHVSGGTRCFGSEGNKLEGVVADCRASLVKPAESGAKPGTQNFGTSLHPLQVPWGFTWAWAEISGTLPQRNQQPKLDPRWRLRWAGLGEEGEKGGKGGSQ